MRKMDKPRERAIVAALTEVCEAEKQRNSEFAWISHRVNYQRFPDSLLLICAYRQPEHLARAISKGETQAISQQITQALAQRGISLTKPQRQLRFISEQQS